MAITSFQVQNMLRTYAKQLSRGQRLARQRAQSRPQPGDQVNISIEARRKQVINKITSEIVSSIGYKLPGLASGWSEVEQRALQELSREYGKPLDISQDEVSGQLMFRVVDPNSGELVQELSQEESADLQERLYAITQDIIDKNMV